MLAAGTGVVPACLSSSQDLNRSPKATLRFERLMRVRNSFSPDASLSSSGPIGNLPKRDSFRPWVR